MFNKILCASFGILAAVNFAFFFFAYKTLNLISGAIALAGFIGLFVALLAKHQADVDTEFLLKMYPAERIADLRLKK